MLNPSLTGCFYELDWPCVMRTETTQGEVPEGHQHGHRRVRKAVYADAAPFPRFCQRCIQAHVLAIECELASLWELCLIYTLCAIIVSPSLYAEVT